MGVCCALLQIRLASFGSKTTGFHGLLHLHRTNNWQMGTGVCVVGGGEVCPKLRRADSHCSYLRLNSVIWINASQFAVCLWTTAKVLKQLFLTFSFLLWSFIIAFWRTVFCLFVWFFLVLSLGTCQATYTAIPDVLYYSVLNLLINASFLRQLMENLLFFCYYQ